MAKNSSARAREHTPHSVNSTPNTPVTQKQTINAALKRRAESIIKDKSIDAHSRVAIKYALEIDDPWLPELVHGIEAGESLTEIIKQLADASNDSTTSDN
jgi:hypothetical protein